MPRAEVVIRDEEVVYFMGLVRDIPIADHIEKYAARILLARIPKVPTPPGWSKPT